MEHNDEQGSDDYAAGYAAGLQFAATRRLGGEDAIKDFNAAAAEDLDPEAYWKKVEEVRAGRDTSSRLRREADEANDLARDHLQREGTKAPATREQLERMSQDDIAKLSEDDFQRAFYGEAATGNSRALKEMGQSELAKLSEAEFATMVEAGGLE